MDLFHEDATFYFPKFGVGQGRESIFEMVKGFSGVLEFIRHDYDGFVFIPSGDRVAVEGTSEGKDARARMEGRSDAGRTLLQCLRVSRRSRSARLHVYLDPDYLGEDEPRFRWGQTNRAW